MNNVYRQQKGAALLIFILFFLLGSTALTLALGRTVYSDLLSFRLLFDSKQSYLAADSGLEDMAHRFIVPLEVDTTEIVVIGGATATTTSSYDSTDDKYNLLAVGVVNNAYRSNTTSLFVGSGASFNFGVQTGNGGFHMANNSFLIGNVFSNGAITGAGSAEIQGDVIAGGPSGSIDGVEATGSAWADTIGDSHIHVDAYYNTESSANVVGGTRYTPSANQATSTLPIPDEKVELIKQDILDNGTVIASTSAECSSGTYTIDFDTTIGFLKIECNVILKKTGPSTTITLDGPIWVEGDLEFTGSGLTIEIDAAIGARTVPIIADNESNRLTSSKIKVTNSIDFLGSGSPKSYILLLSQNESAENGGTEAAVDLNNSANGDILIYAGHGLVEIGNSIALKEVTAYQVDLANGANVTYESGLVNLLFTSGPGGGFSFGTWGETY